MSTITKIPREVSNSEIESGEVVITPSLQTRVVGKDMPHSKGGSPSLLGEGTRILSQHLKADKDLTKNLVGKDKKMSFAEMGKMYNTIPELTALISDKEDDLSKKTAQLMLTKKVAQLDSIYNAQEVQKEETSKNTLDDILGKVSVFKNGGKMKDLPKFQKAGTYTNPYGLFNSNLPIAPQTKTFQKDLGVGTYQPSFSFNPINTNKPYWEQQVESHFQENPMLYQKQGNNLIYSPFDGNEVASWVDKGVRKSNDPRVVDYQADYLGYDPSLKDYKNDKESILKRYGYMKHRFDNRASGWGHENDFIGVLPDGSQENFKLNDQTDLNKYKDFRFPTRKNFQGVQVPTPMDGDIREKAGRVTDNYVPRFSVGYDMNQTPGTQTSLPILPTNFNPNSNVPPITVPLPNEPVKSITPQDNIPYSPNDKPKGVNWDDPYKLNALKDIVDLSTLEVRPPEYNYQPQNIAYQRYLPQNTLAAERQYNLMKTQIENSNLPEQAKQSYLNDLQGKLQDNISEVQMRNYQGDIGTDNQNTQLYNQVTDQNRRERIQYDDKYNELQDRTLFNYGQEKLRLQDQLINNYGKWNQNKMMIDLTNQLGTNYMFNGSEIVYVPGKGSRDTTDPMQQYQENQIQKLLKDLNSATNSVDKKNIADAIKSLQGK